MEAVTGPFDLIVKIQAGHVNEALDIVLHRVRRVPRVRPVRPACAVAPGAPRFPVARLSPCF